MAGQTTPDFEVLLEHDVREFRQYVIMAVVAMTLGAGSAAIASFQEGAPVAKTMGQLLGLVVAATSSMPGTRCAERLSRMRGTRRLWDDWKTAAAQSTPDPKELERLDGWYQQLRERAVKGI